MTKIAVIFKEETEKSWEIKVNDKSVDVLHSKDIPEDLRSGGDEAIIDRIKTCYSICFNSVVGLILEKNKPATDDIKLGRIPSLHYCIGYPKENNTPPISEEEAIEQSKNYAIPAARRYLSMKL